MTSKKYLKNAPQFEHLSFPSLKGPDLKNCSLNRLFGSGLERVTLEPVKKAPTRREVQTWLRARDILKESQKKASSDPAIGQSVMDEGDLDDKAEKQLPMDKSMLRVRVRRNSEDSLGSELSCSPPSSPDIAGK